MSHIFGGFVILWFVSIIMHFHAINVYLLAWKKPDVWYIIHHNDALFQFSQVFNVFYLKQNFIIHLCLMLYCVCISLFLHSPPTTIQSKSTIKYAYHAPMETMLSLPSYHWTKMLIWHHSMPNGYGYFLIKKPLKIKLFELII